jgi:hypothetical protein
MEAKSISNIVIKLIILGDQRQCFGCGASWAVM